MDDFKNSLKHAFSDVYFDISSTWCIIKDGEVSRKLFKTQYERKMLVCEHESTCE